MKKGFILSLVIVVLIIPQVTSAAWWNPFSWNWKALFQSPTPVETIQIPVSENRTQEIQEKKPSDIEIAKSNVETKTVTIPVSPSQPTVEHKKAEVPVSTSKPIIELKEVAIPASTPPQYTISNNESINAELVRKQQRTQELLSLIQDLSDECTVALKNLEKERKALPEVNISNDSAKVMQGSAQAKQLAETQKAVIQAESNRLALIDIGMRQNFVIQYCINEDFKLRTELNSI